MDSAPKVWSVALSELQHQMTRATFETWLQPTQGLASDDQTFTIGVKNGFARDWLDHRLRPTIERTLTDLLSQPVTINFEILERQPGPTKQSTTTEAELHQQELEIDGVRVYTYNEIVEPDRVFVGAQYFREKWLPILGRTTWLLILELRQRCYWNKRTGEKRDTCKVTVAELAAAIGVSESTARRALFPLPQDPKKWPRDKKKLKAAKERAALIGEFIIDTTTLRRYSNKQGREVNLSTLWKIRLDEPLTPEDRKRFSNCQNDR